jgi:SPP1 family predicted phage head-tail adaptor
VPDAGDLDRVIVIEERIERADEYGEMSDSWSSTGETAWCMVESLRASERIQGDKVRGLISHRLTMRYRPTLTNKHRLRETGGRIFNIDGVMEGEGRREWTVVLAQEDGA